MRNARYGEKRKLMVELLKGHPTLTLPQLVALFAKTSADRGIRFNKNASYSEFASERWKYNRRSDSKPQPTTATATNDRKPTPDELTAALNELRTLNTIKQRLGKDGFKAACDLLNAA